MKKYLGISLLTVILCFTGCSDQLDRFPHDSLVEETAYNTVEDLRRALNGAIGSYDYNYILGFNSIFTDNTRLGIGQWWSGNRISSTNIDSRYWSVE